MNLNVLVFPCGSEIGLEIHRSLKYEKNITLYGGSSVENDPGRLVYENYYNNFPLINDPQFLSNFNEFILEHKIDIVYPAMDSVILELSKVRHKIDCKIVLTEEETINICMSKSKTYKYFKDTLKVPKVFDTPNAQDLPLFAKPDIGYGSRNSKLIKDNLELEYIKLNNSSLIFLEYLPGKEYTIDCFTDNRGELLFSGARERKRIVNGISASAIPVDNNEFLEIAKKINSNISFTGAWFFQVKENESGELSLLEIAPRIAGVSGLYRNLGVNFPLLSIYNLLGIQVDIIKNELHLELEKSLVSKFKIDYIYKKVFIDLDDTLIIKNKINLIAINYIYQCKNEGVEVNLITRHSGNLHSYLEKYSISKLFDNIFWIRNQEPKSNYIDSRESIFIDDSFKERQEVKNNKGVPVFSVDAIECLLK